MEPLRFVVIGAGWRAMFYVRIARRYPQCFRLLYLLCRDAARAAVLQAEGIPATVSAEACAAARPDFVVSAVDKTANAAVAREWLAKGFPVLAETPAAQTEEELEALWALHRAGARLCIAEQYTRYPLIAAGLRAVRQGLLGDPYTVTLSVAHDYHAVSLIRAMLAQDAAGRALPAVRMTAHRYTFPVEETDSRAGPITDGRIRPRERTRVTMEFAGGKYAFYDFDGVLYHSRIRARHINVQGAKGEWNDTTLRYVDAEHRPHQEPLRAWLDPAYAVLDTDELRALCRTWQPAVHMEQIQDEYAIAALMLDMRSVIEGGQGGCALAHALEDAYLWQLMRTAAEHPGQTVGSRPHGWQQKQ